MTKIEKENDAAAHAPRPKNELGNAGTDGTGTSADKQDTKNYSDLKDGGRSVPLDDLNSANDE